MAKSVENLSNIYGKSIERLSNNYRTSVDNVMQIYHHRVRAYAFSWFGVGEDQVVSPVCSHRLRRADRLVARPYCLGQWRSYLPTSSSRSIAESAAACWPYHRPDPLKPVCDGYASRMRITCILCFLIVCPIRKSFVSLLSALSPV